MNQRDEQQRCARARAAFYAVWAVIGVVVLTAAAVWGLGRISGVLAPFVIAFLFVFIFQRPVSLLEERGVKRSRAVGLCFLAAFLVVSLIGVFIIPPIGREIVAFANATPGYFRLGQDLLESTQQRFSEMVIPAWVRQAADAVSSSAARMFVRLGDLIARGVVSAGGGIATVVFDLFLGAVIAFWTIRDLPKIRSEMRIIAGDAYEDDLENLVSTVGRVVGGYLKGQTIVSFVTGVLAAAGLALIGVPYALVLGIVTFFSNFVPYIGPLLAGLVAGVVGLFVGPLQAVLAIAVVVAAQQATDLLVTPRVMSEQVDLHPVLVIFSLLAGGTLFGFWGLIFAIPVAATAKGLFIYYWEARTDRSLASRDGALFRSAPFQEESRHSADESRDGLDASEEDTQAQGSD